VLLCCFQAVVTGERKERWKKYQQNCLGNSQKEETMQKVNLNTITDITDEELKQVMDYHPWGDTKKEMGQKVRDALGQALKTIIQYVPPCPDRTVAIRKIREARMDANSAITHDGAF